MIAREARIPTSRKTCLTEAGERTAKLYEAWGKPEKASAWRAKLIRPPTPAKPDPYVCGPTRDG
jgi:hypothetical protein